MSVLDNALDTDPSSENAVCNPEEGSAKLAGVSGYLPTDFEVDALPLMMHFKKLKKKVVVPSIYKKSLVFVDWDVESQFKYSAITCDQNPVQVLVSRQSNFY